MTSAETKGAPGICATWPVGDDDQLLVAIASTGGTSSASGDSSRVSCAHHLEMRRLCGEGFKLIWRSEDFFCSKVKSAATVNGVTAALIISGSGNHGVVVIVYESAYRDGRATTRFIDKIVGTPAGKVSGVTVGADGVIAITGGGASYTLDGATWVRRN